MLCHNSPLTWSVVELRREEPAGPGENGGGGWLTLCPYCSPCNRSHARPYVQQILVDYIGEFQSREAPGTAHKMITLLLYCTYDELLCDITMNKHGCPGVLGDQKSVPESAVGVRRIEDRKAAIVKSVSPRHQTPAALTGPTEPDQSRSGTNLGTILGKSLRPVRRGREVGR
jgi:hypothetical protein